MSFGRHSTPPQLGSFGQTAWLFPPSPGSIHARDLDRLLANAGWSGLILDLPVLIAAIVKDPRKNYVRRLARDAGSASEICRSFAIERAQRAADILRPQFEKTQGRDGWASLAISPELAYDCEAAIDEARALWRDTGRPNLMIAISATREVVPAICQLIEDGINVMASPVVGLRRYEEVARAYIAGFGNRNARNLPLDGVASVAGFPLGVVDAYSKLVANHITRTGAIKEDLHGLRRRVARMFATLAYQTYKSLFGSREFRTLAAKGARAQRILWLAEGGGCRLANEIASVDDLVASATLAAFTPGDLQSDRPFGNDAPRPEQDDRHAQLILDHLRSIEYDEEPLLEELEGSIIKERVLDLDRAMAALEDKRRSSLAKGD